MFGPEKEAWTENN